MGSNPGCFVADGCSGLFEEKHDRLCEGTKTKGGRDAGTLLAPRPPPRHLLYCPAPGGKTGGDNQFGVFRRSRHRSSFDGRKKNKPILDTYLEAAASKSIPKKPREARPQAAPSNPQRQNGFRGQGLASEPVVSPDLGPQRRRHGSDPKNSSHFSESLAKEKTATLKSRAILAKKR